MRTRAEQFRLLIDNSSAEDLEEMRELLNAVLHELEKAEANAELGTPQADEEDDA